MLIVVLISFKPFMTTYLLNVDVPNFFLRDFPLKSPLEIG
jgi:hypothetical protein